MISTTYSFQIKGVCVVGERVAWKRISRGVRRAHGTIRKVEE